MSWGRRRILGVWLAGCSVMVGGAVIIGGITRLTESGLSMTQWHLVKGMRPPRSEEEWEAEFERYKQFPEFKVVHQDLSLEGYKRIFQWEYFHRMWGRATGLAVLVPAAAFWAAGWLTPRLKKRAGPYSVLVVLQGLYGWYMVKSGLASRPSRIQPGTDEVPRVSQYRLAGHLSLALLLYSSMLYTALGLLAPPATIAPAVGKVNRLRHLVHGATATIFLTCISGAFVAGLDAGLVYNSFPKMAGRWVPEDIASLSPKTYQHHREPHHCPVQPPLAGNSHPGLPGGSVGLGKRSSSTSSS
ncbi:Cytochrome c oxidase assembly protein COX15 homolog [Geodia barretti]|uniref:Cytochrome c oxidase assembly protein COX15 homolog n=2 Tax=Geodia barretti TaxID=519541 RepID=A0AA35RR46_GEOBA|nr:Cytochrome c oxidase assembly protein COX15 homolog [Geodia barretti]